MLRLMDTKAVVRMVNDQGQPEYVPCDCDDLRMTMGFDNKIIVTRDAPSESHRITRGCSAVTIQSPGRTLLRARRTSSP
jgi:hypothetical protein